MGGSIETECYWKPHASWWDKKTEKRKSNLIMSMEIDERVKVGLLKSDDNKNDDKRSMAGPYRGEAVINKVDGNGGEENDAVRKLEFSLIPPRSDDVINEISDD